MSSSDSKQCAFPVGLYEQLETPAVRAAIEALGLRDRVRWARGNDIDVETMPARMATQIASTLGQALAEIRDRDGAEWTAALTAICNALQTSGAPLQSLAQQWPCLPPKLLLEVQPTEAAALRQVAAVRPDVGLALASLLTGSRHSPSLVHQLEAELASADRADWLVSFVKFSGIRALRDALQRFTQTPAPDGGPRLRVATTSYLGATDLKAIETLLDLPNTELRVSYDSHRTRLHAKAYLFHRRTGFGSAYVGSANLSRVAIDEGLEWTAHITAHQLPDLWQQLDASFAMHWNDPAEFEPCTRDNLPRLRAALEAERGSVGNGDALPPTYFDLKPYGFQQEILDTIAAERAAGLDRHLVIAATGTGKTLIAAFDYRAICQTRDDGMRPSLLFVAHREEILRQAQASFRQVLRDADFGDLVVGGSAPVQQRHLFCTVQSWQVRGLGEFSPGHFDYVVLDEAHHAAAASYQRLLAHVQPKTLLGLTATPERADGADIRDHFGGRFSHELRLPDAIEARRLVPFHDFGVHDADGVDFRGLAWGRGGYRRDDLDRVIGHNERRARWVLNAFIDHLADPMRARALGFCVSRAHAEFMADFFRAQGCPAAALTADSPADQRRRVQTDLVSRRIQVIFTVDLYNEGVDIPEVDCVLLLRPTESLTVYLQQLGRGLRLHDDKSHLTVLDFIAPQHRQFRFAERFRALSSHPERSIVEQIESGFRWLPAGCLIKLDRVAQARVLEHVRNALDQRRPQWVQSLRRLQSELRRRPRFDEIVDILTAGDADAALRHGPPGLLLAEPSDAVRARTFRDGTRCKFAENRASSRGGRRRSSPAGKPARAARRRGASAGAHRGRRKQR